MSVIWSQQNLQRVLDLWHAEPQRIDDCHIGEEIVVLRGKVEQDNFASKPAPIVEIAQQGRHDAVEITVADGYIVVVSTTQRILVCNEAQGEEHYVQAMDLTLRHCCQIVTEYDYFAGGLYGDSQIVSLTLKKDMPMIAITTPPDTHLICNNIVV